MKVKIINKSNNQNPFYQTSGSSGMDLRAFLSSSVILLPGERKLVPTGIYIEIPKDYEAQVRSRSGLALKKGISVLNSPGTIDADYRGEIGVILINSSKTPFEIKPSDRIAQLVFINVHQPKFDIVKDFNESLRGKDGFGSSGNK